MIIHMKPGAKNHAPFSTSRTSYGAYFVERVVAQQGRYIMASMMRPLKQLAENKIACQLWKPKSEENFYFCIYKINHKYP